MNECAVFLVWDKAWVEREKGISLTSPLLFLLTEMYRIIVAYAHFTLTSRGISGGNGYMNPKGTMPTSVPGHVHIYGVQILSTVG